MNYANKDIASMADDELISANNDLNAMLQNRQDKQNDSRWAKRNVPSIVNPTFLEIQQAIIAEASKRNLWL